MKTYILKTKSIDNQNDYHVAVHKHYEKIPLRWLRSLDGVFKISELCPGSRFEILGPDPGYNATKIYITAKEETIEIIKKEMAEHYIIEEYVK